MKIMVRNLSRDTTEAELLILFNGYGEFVADMYKGMEEKQSTWM